MRNWKRYLALSITLLMICGLNGLLYAQTENQGADNSASQSAPPAPENPSAQIQLDTTGDTSLFVGYYRLNPGDTVKVEVLSTGVQTFWQMIDEEGYIALPIVGRVLIANLTTTEARDEIQLLVDKYYVSAWVTLQVTQLGKVKFYVYGDVQKPGFYTATGATTVFDFLQVFGLTTGAVHRRIVHVRGNPFTALPEENNLLTEEQEPFGDLVQRSLDLYAEGDLESIDPRVTIVDPLVFTLQGEIEQTNFYLEFGDIIFVPDPGKSVSVQGFTRPGQIEVLPGEGWPEILAIAGPPQINTNPAGMILERRDDEGRLTQLVYNLNILSDDELRQIPVENRDMLKVLANQTNVFVLGQVTTAGAYPYQASLTPYDYLAEAGGPTASAHLRFVIILRPSRDPLAPMEDSEIIQCDLGEPLVNENASSPCVIEPGDIIFVPDKGATTAMGDVFSALSIIINAARLF
jgi:polysaccharide export outer membrane protein